MCTIYRLYVIVAFFADFNTSLGGSYLWHGSRLASFNVIMLDKVPSKLQAGSELCLGRLLCLVGPQLGVEVG